MVSYANFPIDHLAAGDVIDMLKDGKKLGVKLIPLTTGPGASKIIEFEEDGLSVKYGYDPERKLKLDTSACSDSLREFLVQLENRAIEVAAEVSEEVTGKKLTAANVRKFKWTSDASKNQLSLEIKPGVTNLYRVLGKQPGTDEYDVEAGDDVKIERGCRAWAAVQVLRLYYSNGNFGMNLRATTLAVEEKREAGNDFVYPGMDEGVRAKNLETNRLLNTLDLTRESQFGGKLYTKGMLDMYYFNGRPFQAGESAMPVPFAFELDIDNNTGQPKNYGSITLNLLDDNAAAAFEAFDKHVVNGVTSKWASWFPGTEAPSAEAVHDMNMYQPVLRRDPGGRYPPRVRAKVFASGDRATQIYVFNPDTQSYDKGTHEALEQGSSVLAQIKISHVFFKGNKGCPSGFGVTMQVAKLLVLGGASVPGAEQKPFQASSRFKVAKRSREPTDASGGDHKRTAHAGQCGTVGSETNDDVSETSEGGVFETSEGASVGSVNFE